MFFAELRKRQIWEEEYAQLLIELQQEAERKGAIPPSPRLLVPNVRPILEVIGQILYGTLIGSATILLILYVGSKLG